MPIYEYECKKEDCGHQFEELLSFSQSDDPQVCPVCGNPARKLISQCDFILAGDGWCGKAMRIKTQMKEKNKRLDAKMKDLPKTRLVPNVGGEQVDTWSEAKKLAASQGKIHESYEPLVEREKITR